MHYLGSITDRPDTLALFAQDHGLAIALALIFAFLGAVFVAPVVTK